MRNETVANCSETSVSRARDVDVDGESSPDEYKSDP